MTLAQVESACKVTLTARALVVADKLAIGAVGGDGSPDHGDRVEDGEAPAESEDADDDVEDQHDDGADDGAVEHAERSEEEGQDQAEDYGFAVAHAFQMRADVGLGGWRGVRYVRRAWSRKTAATIAHQ